MFRESWRQMWDKAAEFLNNKIDVLVNNAGVSPKLGYDICMKVNNVVFSKYSVPAVSIQLLNEFLLCMYLVLNQLVIKSYIYVRLILME